MFTPLFTISVALPSYLIFCFLLMPFPFNLQKFLQDFRAELLAMNPVCSFTETAFLLPSLLKMICSRDIKFLVNSFSLLAFQGLLPLSFGPHDFW